MFHETGPSETLALVNLEFLHLNQNITQIKENYNTNIYDIPPSIKSSWNYKTILPQNKTPHLTEIKDKIKLMQYLLSS